MKNTSLLTGVHCVLIPSALCSRLAAGRTSHDHDRSDWAGGGPDPHLPVHVRAHGQQEQHHHRPRHCLLPLRYAWKLWIESSLLPLKSIDIGLGGSSTCQ
jgi:hypothetical protein